MRFFSALLCLAITSSAQTPQFTDSSRRAKLAALAPEIDTLFERYLRDTNAPGLIYGYVVDDEIVHLRAFGIRDNESKAPVTPETVFRIASMTKSFTALAILKLRDQGKLSLDDPATKWIPELSAVKLPTADSAPITVRHLLTHSGGFPEDNPWGDRQLHISDSQFSQWLKAGLPFSTPPGTAFEYANYGFALLGRIVANASGKSYEDYLQSEILNPLGLSSATLESAQVPAAHRAIGYGRRDGKLFEIPSLAHGAFGAMGGLLINARDLGRYVAFHLSAEPARDAADTGPVRRSSMREMQQAWRSSNFMASKSDAELRAATSAYGYGLSVTRDCEFPRIVAHGGGLPGFGSYMTWLPEYGVGFFAMANLTYSGPSRPIRQALKLMNTRGALTPRQLPVSESLTTTRTALTNLWNDWQDSRLDSIAADNLYQDLPRELIRARFSQLKTQFTACQPEGDLIPENWLRGTFTLACQQGRVEISFTLAPTTPPLVQYLDVTGIANPTRALRNAAQNFAKRSPYGACTLGRTLPASDNSAAFELQCPTGAAALTLRPEGKAFKPAYSLAPDKSCTP